tara:strand:- start:1813 stop:1941 length:129 start_codon:yes stop_codon:yes gene_type:complete
MAFDQIDRAQKSFQEKNGTHAYILQGKSVRMDFKLILTFSSQ